MRATIKNVTFYIQNMERKTILFILLLFFCFSIAIVFLFFYFAPYHQPYMMKDVVTLSEGWRYSTNDSDPVDLHTAPAVNPGETLVLNYPLNEKIEDAAILVRANHQSVNIYLEENPLYMDRSMNPGENPGMALHVIPLPKDYLQKTLRVEFTSPYSLYSGRVGSVLMGTIISLEAYMISQSMHSVMMMAMCLLLGFATIALALMQALRKECRPENLALGIFAILWGLYWVCTEYIVFQFFTPFWMSALSMGLYFSFQAPLALYFYFSFRHYRKWMLPAAILHTVFPAVAILLQVSGIMDFPRLVTLNNIFLAGLVYTLALSILEGIRHNRVMAVASAFLALSYISMLFNFSAFYTGYGVPPYSYKYTYFLLLLCVLSYNIQQFFNSYYRNRQKNQRIAAELNVATQIQADMLPCTFPPFPNRKELDIYASMLPAKEVGGDFYDFFWIDEDTLAVVIADVSGKGVPAALFMVIAKTLIKSNAQSGKSPKEVFESVNHMLCENNETGMFVTAFMAYVDFKKGVLTYVNAGHNPPLIKRAQEEYNFMKSKPSLVLAGFEGTVYREFCVAFSVGDILYLYTDGITEAVNRSNHLFTEARLLEVANKCKDQSVKDQLVYIKREIDIFADGAEQADDMTMLALHHI